jgi:hypothetical protein
LAKRVGIACFDKNFSLQENIAIKCIKMILKHFAAFSVTCGSMHMHIGYTLNEYIKGGHNSLFK